MYLLKNQRNLGDAKGITSPGDVVVSGDFTTSYVVAPDGSHRNMEPADHLFVVDMAKRQILEAPARREQSQLSKEQLEAAVMARFA